MFRYKVFVLEKTNPRKYVNYLLFLLTMQHILQLFSCSRKFSSPLPKSHSSLLSEGMNRIKLHCAQRNNRLVTLASLIVHCVLSYQVILRTIKYCIHILQMHWIFFALQKKTGGFISHCLFFIVCVFVFCLFSLWFWFVVKFC